ncbi:glycine-rich extracellular protein 1 isoform X2 [Rhineura floridana]|uniref:glycine-rich extracellular protein 1 isoform X2 n=1 Tax=Rhineura floridana TaxID=261503 RepID=UPI002AC87695|nr:glycine-rich extracellular protein 1 isoform X2 [Rhineura floridana]
MAKLNLCTSLLLLCLVGGSLQGGVFRPQSNGRGALYFPSLIRGVGGVQPGVGLGPAGAKAGKYPVYGTQGLPAGLGAQIGFGTGTGFGSRPGKPGYRVPVAFGAGYRGLGYPRPGLPLGGLGARGKPSKAGYGAGPSANGYPTAGAQQAYLGGVGAGGYPSNGLQNGYGYGAGGNGFPGVAPKPGRYGNGAQAPYGSQLGGPAGDPAAAKYGGAGQLPYSGQPEGVGLGGDYGAGRYGVPQSPYGAQPGGSGGISVDPAAAKYGNGNGMGYMNGGDLQANGLGAGAYSPLTAGQVPEGYGSPLGPGQAVGGYGGKEAKYGLNGFLGNGYRDRCASGKC